MSQLITTEQVEYYERLTCPAIDPLARPSVRLRDAGPALSCSLNLRINLSPDQETTSASTQADKRLHKVHPLLLSLLTRYSQPTLATVRIRGC